MVDVQKWIYTVLFSIGCFFCSNNLTAQDSLTIEKLVPMCRSFSILDGQMSGDGAQFLEEEVEKAQFTLLGEYHGSRRISAFTKALIPILDKADYKHMVLEVGPHSGALLDKLSNDKPELIATLKEINQKYARHEGDEVCLPIPFFDKVEDAEFLAEAKSRNWKLIGIDQEFIDAYILNMDLLYQNLSIKDRAKHSGKFAQVKDTIHRMYLMDEKNGVPVYSSMLKSNFVQEFLDEMRKMDVNQVLVDDLRISMEIYQKNSDRQWYENNGSRIKHMKVNLNRQLEACGFDISKDKLMAKMGGYHISQGFSPLGFYEVGNTLNEIAEYHGNTALNIGFINRYWEEEGKIVDALEENVRRIEWLKNFYALGKKDEWLVLDFRPLRKGFYYHPQQYKLSIHEEQLIQRYDVMIVVPTDGEGKNNY